MSSLNKGSIRISTFVTLLAMLWGAEVSADSKFNLPSGVSPVSHEIYDLHMLILTICIIIAGLVYVAMFYSIYTHRKSKGAVAAQFHENAWLEVLWTVIPIVILVAMAVPATKAMINIYDTDDADMTVKITGHQWKWQYEYLNEGIGFFSNLKTPSEQIYGSADKGAEYLLEVDNPLVLPVNKKVRFVITASDVLHAWWVPVFGWKQDAIPGYINDAWVKIEQPGTYKGQCAELCGRGHGFMPIVVEAKSEDEYLQWVAAKKQEEAAEDSFSGKTFTQDELMAKGKEVYETACAACHQANGQGIPGAFPAMAGSKVALGPIADHIDIVLNGKQGSSMPAFKEQLNDFEVAAVVTYERNAFGNNKGDVVQPAQVESLETK